jgi:signal transduction histidine kinase/HAMP domain-containing protein
VKLATRLFASMSLLVAAAVAGSIVATDVLLRRHLEAETAAGLEREARLIAVLAPADSVAWPDFARLAGERLGGDRRVTLIDPAGRVRGDTEFDRVALAHLENHASRPEVRDALATGAGRAERLSASTNARQLYVAMRGGPPGIAVVRVSASLAAVDARVHAVQRAALGAGLAMLVLAALVGWLLARALAQPLIAIGGAARAIAAGGPAAFPDVQIPELARLVDALRTMHDELERRLATLRREREESRTLLEALSDGVIAADARGAIGSCNAAARRLLGYGADDPLPPLAELFHDQRHRTLVREVLEGRAVERREMQLGDRTVLVSGRTLPDGGALLVMSDVTDIRRLEAVRRDFVANVSHELKTPLTAIAGYAETLAGEAPAGSPAAGFATTIVQNARRMQRLVDDLLDLSRIESGGWRPQPRVVDLEAAARDAWAPFAERAAGGGVRFEVAVAPEAHAVPADPDALRQIFTNLFDNALRHTPRGGTIRVAAETAKEGVALQVTDSGSGIPPEHLPRIFERFYRVDAGRARQQGGTGLGLAIVKHLVESHGGRVEADSAVGRGTTIRLHFPAATRP